MEVNEKTRIDNILEEISLYTKPKKIYYIRKVYNIIKDVKIIIDGK